MVGPYIGGMDKDHPQTLQEYNVIVNPMQCKHIHNSKNAFTSALKNAFTSAFQNSIQK